MPKLVFARHAQGNIRHIADVVGGVACECTCLDCGQPLVARKGPIREHHFGHSSGQEHDWAWETHLHAYAKQLIAEAGGLVVPLEAGICRLMGLSTHGGTWRFKAQASGVQRELRRGEVRPDLVFSVDGQAFEVALEIYVTIPIMRIDSRGAAGEFGTLIPCVGGKSWVQEFEEPLKELHDGLPWLLVDMRPQGFLGRSFAHSHKELGLADNPDHWKDDDVLKALCVAGEDLPGNLIVGEQSFARHLRAQPAPRVTPGDYPTLADQAMRGALLGSFVGGEQPKFCTVRAEDGQPVIVKFSPRGGAPADRRWADLLVCEHLALTTLREAGIPAAVTRVFQGDGRVLLEVQRFDRTPQGRIGMMSLLAFDAQYIGHIDNRAASAERMVTRGLMKPQERAEARNAAMRKDMGLK